MGSLTRSMMTSRAFHCHRHLISRPAADLHTMMIELHLGLFMAMGIYMIGSPAGNLIHGNARAHNRRIRLVKRRPSSLKQGKGYVHSSNESAQGCSLHETTSRWAPKEHRMMDKILQRHCARSSVTIAFIKAKHAAPHLAFNSESPWKARDEFWIKWRYGTPSRLETLF